MVSSKGEWKLKNKNERKNVLFLQKCIFFVPLRDFTKLAGEGINNNT